jgi:hypothetical protein
MKLITKTSCGHRAIYYEQNEDNNDWIQVLYCIHKKTIDFSNKNKKKILNYMNWENSPNMNMPNKFMFISITT